MSKIPVHMFVSVSYRKQGGFKKKRKVRPCVGRTFFSLISYQKAFRRRATADSRSFVSECLNILLLYIE